MPVYNSYTGIWILPISALTMTLEHTVNTFSSTLATTELTFVNAEANSSLAIEPIAVPDFNNGGERTVGFVGSITFVAPYNDFGSMEIDFDAITRGRITSMALTLQAQDAQPKGGLMTVEGNVWQPINDWTVKPRFPQVEMRPTLELILNGVMSSAMFAVVDVAAHRASMFSAVSEL
jgi:hypothetical protein